jgi:trans-2-enoyl-CoA reductase
MGADVVVVDGPDLAKRVEQETGGAAIHLAIDAVAGSATGRLAQCLSEGGTVVNYGLMSGEPIQIDAFQFVFRDIHLVGFWLSKAFRTMSFEAIQAMYGKLAAHVVDGTIHVPVEASYPLERIAEAMAHAKRESRGGKVQLRPND